MNRILTTAFVLMLGSLVAACTWADEKPSSDSLALTGIALANEDVSTNRIAGPGKVLTTAQQVLALKPEDAARGYPVRIRCVVTYYDSTWGALFVQDQTAGIYVNTYGYTLDLELGQWIELEGVTGPGQFSPIITRSRFQILGRAPLPPAQPHSLKDLYSGKKDSQWLAIDGIVHSVQLEKGHLIVRVAEGGGHFEVVIPHRSQQPVPTHLVDANVRLTGVCGTIFNQKRQLMGVRLFVPSLEFVTLEGSAEVDPFSRPIRPINSLFQFTSAEETDHRIHVQGAVTLRRPKEFFFVQDETGGLLVKTEQAAPLEIGDRVEVVGFAATGNYTPVLTQATFRNIGAGRLPEPAAVTAEQALSADFNNDIFDAKLIRLQGRLIDLSASTRERALVLQQSGMIFSASLDGDATNQLRFSLPIGSLLELTGVCSVQVDSSRHPKSFQIYLRSPADIKVLEAPSWWNIRHAMGLLAFTGIVILLSETVQVSDLVEDALCMNRSALVRHDVEAIREFEVVPSITVEKHKVLQILVNLIRNAKYACDAAGGPGKRLTVRVTNGDNRVRIAVIDNGIGIPPENLTRIFNHGFTTRKDGHGFGLHSGALAAQELGGSLTPQSDGSGQGATFTLELPLDIAPFSV